MADFSTYDHEEDSTCDFLNDENKSKRYLSIGKALQVVKYASKSVDKLVHSDDFALLKENSVLPFEVRHNQIELGKMLGKGSFSEVYEIKTSQIDEIEPDSYVVKVLHDKMIDDAELFAASAVGLAIEGTILSVTSHQNIIQMKAWAHRGLHGYSSGRVDAFFIVLDRLDEMLSDRLLDWRQQAEKLRFCLRQRNRKFDDFLCHRTNIAKDLAGAVAYLHQNRIVHRDLKPPNIGFQDGVLKLFDFDVSRFLPEETEEKQLFHMTTKTGTRRYMSPECGLARPYNEKTDVYSFAILFHEILSLQKPFQSLSKREHENKVFEHGVRPTVNHSWPRRIRSLLVQSWSDDPHARPDMVEVRDVLAGELDAMMQRLTSAPRRVRLGGTGVRRSFRLSHLS